LLFIKPVFKFELNNGIYTKLTDALKTKPYDDKKSLQKSEEHHASVFVANLLYGSAGSGTASKWHP
jgi:hypothetical protein